MPIEVPRLDDQSYDDLLAEALRRIPVHTPEWTNYGIESDPGTTLVQLFAFVADNLAYRANRVPEKNRLQFLRLLGIGLQPAACARGIVAIRNARGALAAVALEAGATFSAGDVTFSSEDPLTVLPVDSALFWKRPAEQDTSQYQALYADLEKALGGGAADDLAFYESVQQPVPTPADPAPVVDVAETLDQVLYVALLAREGADAEDVRAEIAGRTLSLGFVPAVLDRESAVLPSGPLGSTESTPQLVVELWNVDEVTGVEQARWKPLDASFGTDVLEETGVLQVELPAAPELPRWTFKEPNQEGTRDYPPLVEDEETEQRIIVWLRLRHRSAAGAQTSSVTGRFHWIGANATRVRQSVRVTDELLGTGTGEPDQELHLAGKPVLTEGLELRTQLPGSPARPTETWRLTDDLLSAGDDDRVYALDPEAGTITFGDGHRGRRPAAGSRIFASYSHGGGTQGNVGIGEVSATTVAVLLGGFEIQNPVPTHGGDSPESVADGERNVASYVRHRDRLVTVEDFEDIAWRTPGVDIGRVEVLPLLRPDLVGEDSPGAVTVLVVPEATAERSHWPSPDHLFLQTVCKHLEPRRLITTELYVVGPTYVSLSVSVGIQVKSGRSRDRVRDEVQAALRRYLSALGDEGPEGDEGNGWPLGRTVTSKELEAVAARVSGVDFVHGLLLGGTSAGALDSIDVTGLELPRIVSIGVQEGPPASLDDVRGQGPPVSGDDVVPVPVVPDRC